MPDYQNGKIYKLYSPSKNIVYIGSTTQTLAQRLTKHNYHYKIYNNDNTKKYYSSFFILDCEDYKIELLEEYACNNRQQLEKKEGEYIRNNECVNKHIAGRTNKEYYEDNADKIKEYYKQYFRDNIDKIKEYYANNANERKQKSKQYYIENADKIKEYTKQRYLKKKLEIKE